MIMDSTGLVELAVETIWKGQVRERATIITGFGGGDCGYPFELGKQYLVYVDVHRNDAGKYSTNTCTRTGHLETSSADLNFLGASRRLPAVETAVPPSYQFWKFKLEDKLFEWLLAYHWSSRDIHERLSLLAFSACLFFAIRYIRRIKRQQPSNFPSNLAGWNWLVLGSIVIVRASLELWNFLDRQQVDSFRQLPRINLGYGLFALLSCIVGWGILKGRRHARYGVILVAVPTLSYGIYLLVVLAQLDEISNLYRWMVLWLSIMAVFSLYQLWRVTKPTNLAATLEGKT